MALEGLLNLVGKHAASSSTVMKGFFLLIDAYSKAECVRPFGLNGIEVVLNV